MILSKSTNKTIKINAVFALILVMFSMRALDGTPLELIQIPSLILVSFVGIFYFRNEILKGLSSRKRNLVFLTFFLYLVILTFALMQGSSIYGQSVVDNLVANSSILTIMAVPVFVLLARKKDIMPQVEAGLLFLIWTNLILYILLNFLFGHEEVNFDSFFSQKNYIFDSSKVVRTFIHFGVFYYFIKFIYSEKSIFLFYSVVLFLLPNLIEAQRGEILCVAAVYMLAIISYSNSAIKVKVFIFFMLAVGLMAFVNGSSETIREQFLGFTDFFGTAIRTVIFGEESNEASSMGRIRQFLYVFEGLVENFWMGNGKLRAGTKEDFIGELYFHPSDIGIVGAVYVYGFLCIPIYILMLTIPFSFMQRINSKTSILAQSVVLYLVFHVLLSIQNASIIFHAQQSFVIMGILITEIKTNYAST